MEPRDFCYWLQGFFEIEGIGLENDMEGIHPEQAKIIRDHLSLVFTNVTKNISEKKQANPVEIPPVLSKEEIEKAIKDIEKKHPSLTSLCRDKNRRYC